jgi:MFS family permease
MVGIGLGGEFGIGMTLVSETWLSKLRAKATSFVAIGYQIGTVLAMLCVLFIAPSFGWQSVFAIGTLPAIFAFWSRHNLKEPPIWQNLKDQKQNKITPKLLFKDVRTVKITIGLIIATSVQNFGFFAVMTWIPTILSHQIGSNFGQTLLWTVCTVGGMIVGITVFGCLCDRIGRHPSYIIFLLSAAIIVGFYFQLHNITWLIVFGAVLGFFINGMIGGYGALLAEHYPTTVRSSAENVIFNIGRSIAGFAPIIIGGISMRYSLNYALSLISAIYIISALSFIFFDSRNQKYPY